MFGGEGYRIDVGTCGRDRPRSDDPWLGPVCRRESNNQVKQDERKWHLNPDSELQRTLSSMHHKNHSKPEVVFFEFHKS